MDEIDKFLTHIYDNIDNTDIVLTKKMKYGYKHYYINISIEYEEDTKSSGGTGFYFTQGANDFVIVIDNRNRCIDIFFNMESVVIEDSDLVNKWSQIFEDYIQTNLNKKVEDLINNVFTNTKQKGILRDFKLKKMDI